jgi:hypothetical protein
MNFDIFYKNFYGQQEDNNSMFKAFLLSIQNNSLITYDIAVHLLTTKKMLRQKP